jgi:hypothetical protein
VAAADQWHLTAKASIADIAIKVENDWPETVRKLAQAHGLSTKMVYTILHKDLKLSKKSARWVTKLMDKPSKCCKLYTINYYM